MNIEEAQQAIAMLQAAFPATRLPPSTVMMWANTLAAPPEKPDRIRLSDAGEAAQMLALNSKRMPSLSEYGDAIRKVMFARLSAQTKVLPAESPDQLLAAIRNGRSPSDDPT